MEEIIFLVGVVSIHYDLNVEGGNLFDDYLIAALQFAFLQGMGRFGQ
ncbi:hypothetical protein SAMN02746093_01330 [Legionella quinlivanii DSM 21216]|nr:hypothetical protein SAMN02746093_01330 [Legionella quinlivanii DSM 21216]STY12481.1 Uncharacterised protein [Legionella quinlivanii]